MRRNFIGAPCDQVAKEWTAIMPESLAQPTRIGCAAFEPSALDSQDVHRTGAGADPAKAVAHGLRRDELRAPRSRERLVSVRQTSGQRRRMRAAGAVRRAVRIALPGDRNGLAAVEVDVGGLV